MNMAVCSICIPRSDTSRPRGRVWTLHEEGCEHLTAGPSLGVIIGLDVLAGVPVPAHQDDTGLAFITVVVPLPVGDFFLAA